MNCHGNNQEKQGNHKHSPLKHMLHMVLCCGLPIVIIGLLPVISKFSPGASRILGVIAPFICPIMMVGMMATMFGGKKKSSCCDNKNNEIDNRELPKLNKPVE